MNSDIPNLNKGYKGRFAPSPTGPLHFGSMVAAVGSFLQARANQGLWLVRMEDLDPPREVKGAADSILHTLEKFGLYWDGEIIYQSHRTEAYTAILDQLRREGMLYPCGCTRKEIAETGLMGRYGPIYRGICRAGLGADKQPRALRVVVHDQLIQFEDQLRGNFSQRIESEIGDFVVRRADGLFAYQLAVIVDDEEQQVTEIVRGSDLLDNTPRQIHLQQLLNFPTPSYIHLPVAVNSEGQKLSKQSGASSIQNYHPQSLLIEVLHFLNQSPPQELADATLDELWRWAITNWKLDKVPRKDLPAPQPEADD